MYDTKALDVVSTLCKSHTNLLQQDIDTIKELAAQLPLIADLNKANIFVDCPTKEGKHAIVVAEASPTTTTSIYKQPVVGKFAYEAFEPAVFFTLKTGKPMFLNRALTQEGKTAEQSIVPIKGINDRVIGVLIMEKDIDEKLQQQNQIKALSEVNQTLSELLLGITEDRPIISEVLEEAVFFVDDYKKILYFNPSAINLVLEVCSTECRVGTPIYKYFPCIKDLISHPEELLMREIQILKKVFQVKKISLGEHDKVKGTFFIFRDITELREKERELIAKSVAIREIHHRVKNNLQTVASLLRLQMRRGVPEESKVHFEESLHRILSIASVYEIILANSSVDEVDIKGLAEKIGSRLINHCDQEYRDIRITFSGPSFELKSKKAVTVALVINELIQNCLKHAFCDRKQGLINVNFILNNTKVEVQVVDNGKGYAPSTNQSLGLDIVRMMVEHDLAGEFIIKRAEIGTSASIIFEVE